MADIPPQAPSQQKPGVPQIDINQLMQMYDPKQLQMLSQALMGLLKFKAATAPKPDPRQMLMQPGPMEQLAALDLQRRKRAAMQQRQAQGARPMPIPIQGGVQ